MQRVWSLLLRSVRRSTLHWSRPHASANGVSSLKIQAIYTFVSRQRRPPGEGCRRRPLPFTRSDSLWCCLRFLKVATSLRITCTLAAPSLASLLQPPAAAAASRRSAFPPSPSAGRHIPISWCSYNSSMHLRFGDSDDEGPGPSGAAPAAAPAAAGFVPPAASAAAAQQGPFHCVSTVRTDFDAKDTCYVFELAHSPGSSLVAAALSNKLIKLFNFGCGACTVALPACHVASAQDCFWRPAWMLQHLPLIMLVAHGCR